MVIEKTTRADRETRRYDFLLHTGAGSLGARSYSYPIFVQGELDWSAFTARMAAMDADHFTLVADAALPASLLTLFFEHLQATGMPCLLIRLKADEQTKTLETARSLALEARMHGGGTHQSCVVSLGGGVIGNLTGFAASFLVRGVRLVHIPTTLLAATDSILSIKQGVNVHTSSGLLIKNLLGTFYAPEYVLVYLCLWQTLPSQEISAGLGELVKNVIGICPARLREVAELLHPDAVYTLEESHRIFALCFAAKQEVMRNDAHEKGPALVLELGHTFGHALESSTGLRHGFAVGLGLLVAAWISVEKGLLSTDAITHITLLLTRASIPTTLPANVEIETILALMREDNKIGYRSRRPGCHVMVLLERFGHPVLEGGLPLSYVTDAQVRTAIRTLQQHKQLGAVLRQEGASHAV